MLRKKPRFNSNIDSFGHYLVMIHSLSHCTPDTNNCVFLPALLININSHDRNPGSLKISYSLELQVILVPRPTQFFMHPLEVYTPLAAF